jgi:hypothetical protein
LQAPENIRKTLKEDEKIENMLGADRRTKMWGREKNPSEFLAIHR